MKLTDLQQGKHQQIFSDRMPADGDDCKSGVFREWHGLFRDQLRITPVSPDFLSEVKKLLLMKQVYKDWR